MAAAGSNIDARSYRAGVRTRAHPNGAGRRGRRQRRLERNNACFAKPKEKRKVLVSSVVGRALPAGAFTKKAGPRNAEPAFCLFTMPSFYDAFASSFAALRAATTWSAVLPVSSARWSNFAR